MVDILNLEMGSSIYYEIRFPSFLKGDIRMNREEKFEKMLQAVLDEYNVTVEKMEKLKKENKTKTVSYRQLMASKLTLQNIISRYEIYGLIEK